jgi:diguanylate cyclase (GGDEF)-like protein
MPDTILQVSDPADGPEAPTQDIIRGALVESRHRWQHLLGLAVDLAFETDADGRFVFIMPEAPLGWPRDSLIGQPSDLLVGDVAGTDAFNPFRPTEEMLRHRSWLRCHDGGIAMITVSVAPLRNEQGTIVGARGIGVDMTACDAQAAQIAGRLRRAEVLRHILSCVGREVGADAMMDAALWALIRALGAEGAAVIGSPSDEAAIDVLHECGPGASAILPAAAHTLASHALAAHTLAPGTNEAPYTASVDGRLVLTVGCRTRFGTRAGLTIWRTGKARPWDAEDMLLAGSAVNVVRMILDYEAAAREMVHKASTDPLTGLLNRRAFLDEVQRHIARLDRENESGTLMFVDLDAFKAVNDRLGHAVGDDVLVLLANLLRKLVRPGDLIARLGGDEFGVWLSGADHMTAAERADYFCKTAPSELQASLPEPFPDLAVSIGIATRRAGSHEAIEDLTRRADMAMYEVKRGGRRHWRVSLMDGD